jgi:hypothetical protein
MDRYEKAAQAWHGDTSMQKEMVYFLRNYFPDEPHGLTETQICELGTFIAKRYVLSESAVRNEMRHWLKEHVKPQGRCGECRWWCGGADPKPMETRGCKHKHCSPGNVCNVYTMKDHSCPRFAPREDRAARLAREYCDSRKWTTEVQNDLADFLRRNGVEGE